MANAGCGVSALFFPINSSFNTRADVLLSLRQEGFATKPVDAGSLSHSKGEFLHEEYRIVTLNGFLITTLRNNWRDSCSQIKLEEAQ